MLFIGIKILTIYHRIFSRGKQQSMSVADDVDRLCMSPNDEACTCTAAFDEPKAASVLPVVLNGIVLAYNGIVYLTGAPSPTARKI